MGYKLNEKTKEILQETIGIPLKELEKMDEIEIQEYVEKKIGKKLTWSKNARVDGLPIRTMEEVDRQLDKIAKNKNDDWER